MPGGICNLRHSYQAWLACLLLASSSLRAQTPEEPPVVRFRNTVRLVEVDVVAKDKHGKPVPDLEAKDFTLFDNGKPQKITRLSVERGTQLTPASVVSDLEAQPDQPTFSNLHPANATPTVILFDTLNTTRENQSTMRTGLLQSLDHIKEGTPVALLILGDDLTVVSDFTTSKISLANAAGSRFEARMEGFGPPITALKTGNATRDRMIRMATAKAFYADDHERLVRTLAALNIISNQFARMRGRKSLIWITGGMRFEEESKAVEGAIDRLNDSNVAVYTVDARGVLMDPEISAENDANDMAHPMKVEREETRNDILGLIANSTGGVFYRNNNRLDDAIGQALDDRGLVYVLEYYPQHGEWEGTLHKLEVKTPHPGVRLRYRESYRATPLAQPTARDQKQMLAEITASPLEYSGIRFTVEVKTGQAADPHFVLHVPVEEVQWSSVQGKLSAELQFWLIQKRASGADLSATNWKSDLRMPADSYEAATRQGVTLSADIKVEAPAVKVRVLLRDVASGRMGTVDVPADAIPSLKSGH